jgi:hypothetical protein
MTDVNNTKFSPTLCHQVFEMEKRPLLWIGEENILFLERFISGYIFGSQIDSDKKASIDFTHWVKKRLNSKDSLGWAKTLLSGCEGSHKEAMRLYFSLFREYQRD